MSEQQVKPLWTDDEIKSAFEQMPVASGYNVAGKAFAIGVAIEMRNDLTAQLDAANARIAELEGIFLGLKEMPLYVKVELEDGETETPVSIVGVHPLRWRGLYPDTPPTHGFYRYEWPDDESEGDDD